MTLYFNVTALPILESTTMTVDSMLLSYSLYLKEHKSIYISFI